MWPGQSEARLEKESTVCCCNKIPEPEYFTKRRGLVDLTAQEVWSLCQHRDLMSDTMERFLRFLKTLTLLNLR